MITLCNNDWIKLVENIMTCLEESSPIYDSHFKSLERMNSYPVVNSSLNFALTYYKWIKSKNNILGSSLTKIESVIKTVKEKTEPTVIRKLSFIDDSVCKQLDTLEKICPVILESTQTTPISFYYKSIKIATWPLAKTMDVVSNTSTITISTMSSLAHSSLKMITPSILSTTNSDPDKSNQSIDEFLPIEQANTNDSDIDIPKSDLNTKVKPYSRRTQHRLYLLAISEIDILQRRTVAKLQKLRELMKNIKGRTISERERVVEGCESVSEHPKMTNQTFKKPKISKEVSPEIKQLHDIISAVASIKKYATTNTLVSLHFINSNLSLLKNVLIVNQKLLLHSVQVIEKIQIVIEYVMSKLKVYMKSQKYKDVKRRRRTTSKHIDNLDSD